MGRSGCASCARSSTSSKATDTSARERPQATERAHGRERGAIPHDRLDARSIGVLGGTFNPPHRGHLAVARHALRELALERVLLMPAHTAPHKREGGDGWEVGCDPGPEHRLRMCELAALSEPGVCACSLEIERGGVSYTVDTLMSLHASHPNVELTFIVGADAASTLGSWRDPARLIDLAQLAVAARTGAARGPVLDAVAAADRSSGDEHGARASARPVHFLEMPMIDVSSSMVRRRVAHGEPIDELVGAPVASYIAQHALYRGALG